MIAGKINIREFIESFDNTASDLIQVILSLDEKELNTVPAPGSWSAGQVAEHLTRSIASITQALKAKGNTSAREVAERVEELKAVFLNYSLKFKSSDSLLPTAALYEKEALVAELTGKIDEFKDVADKADMTDLIAVRPLGELTKYEVLYLVLYHTQRHVTQLKNILGVIKQSSVVF